MYSRLCMCDVCAEGRLSKGGGGKKGEKTTTKNEKKENTFLGARVRSFDVLG